MNTLTVHELLTQLAELRDRGYGTTPVYIDVAGDGRQLMRSVFRAHLVINSKEKPVAALDSVER